jgi:hypothetical protein
MPQTINAKWRDALGVNYEAVHDRYLHTLGNITLTGYNSKMSNKPFIEKRDMEKGFKGSRLFLNKSLHEIEKWDEDSINNRAQLLKERAMKIWTYPIGSYESEEDKLKLFTLADDDVNFSGEKITSFKFMDDKEKNISSWKDFYKVMLSALFELDPIQFKQIMDNNGYVYAGDSIERDAYKIDSFYIYTNLSAESILSRLRVVIDKIGLDLDDVAFTIN